MYMHKQFKLCWSDHSGSKSFHPLHSYTLVYDCIDSTVKTLRIVSSGHEVLACMHAVQVHPVGEHASFLHLSVVYC